MAHQTNPSNELGRPTVNFSYDLLRANNAELKVDNGRLRQLLKQSDLENKQLRSQLAAEQERAEQLHRAAEQRESLSELVQKLLLDQSVAAEPSVLNEALLLVALHGDDINTTQLKIIEQTHKLKLLAEKLSDKESVVRPEDIDLVMKQPIQCSEDLVPSKQQRVILLPGDREVDASDIERTRPVRAKTATRKDDVTTDGGRDPWIRATRDPEMRLGRDSEITGSRSVVPDNMPGQRVTGLTRSALENMLNTVMPCPFCQREFDLSNEDEKDGFYIHVEDHIDK